MIERLFPEGWDFGGEERREAGEKTAQIRRELSRRLDQESKSQLDRLHTAYIRESNLEIKDAYMQGVCDGMELMMEYCGRRGRL